MSEDAFVIVMPNPNPKSLPAKAEPPPEQGRYFSDLAPDKKARVLRIQAGLFFYEPVFDQDGMTDKWRVGKSELHREFTVAEFNNKDDARASLLKILGKA